jgi:hypothetical protein
MMVKAAVQGYDIIGDIHGCADALRALLQKLGYQLHEGVYRYADESTPRQVVYLGDVLDRGPKIREAMDIVRDMVDHGHAQMVIGNHEYNAICYSTPAPTELDRDYLREHTPRHTHSIKETLEQYADYPDDWQSLLSWIKQLPVFLEFEHFRVVHACWDQRLIDTYYELYDQQGFSEDLLIQSTDYRQFAGRFISRLTQGVGLMLPDKMVMTGSHGYERRSFRAKFWAENPQTYADVEFQPDRLPVNIANYQLSDAQRDHIGFYGPQEKPVFVGHYWMAGQPKALTANIACLDYSGVSGGRLVAYRMDDEKKLDNNKFVWVDGFSS